MEKEIGNIINYPREGKYGTPQYHFQPLKWGRIRNRRYWNKPKGGFWGSPEKTKYGWSSFITSGEMEGWDLRYPTIYRLRPSAKVYIIDSREDLNRYPYYGINQFGDEYCDFQKLIRDYDSIWLTDEGEVATRYSNPGLYGWDVETVLVLRPEAIVYLRLIVSSGLPESGGVGLRLYHSNLVFDGSRWRSREEVESQDISEYQDLGKYRSKKALLRYLRSLKYYVAETEFTIRSASRKWQVRYVWPRK